MHPLDINSFIIEAEIFSALESQHYDKSLYGITDGKAVGTYLEHKFKEFLTQKYTFLFGNSARGIDFPCLNTDMKVTSKKQPQSSCPFRFARQKIYGLGYNLIVFVYEKDDDHQLQTSRLKITDTIFIEKTRTADFQTTKGILEILNHQGNREDLIAFMIDRNLPVDEIGLNTLADDILDSPPVLGFLTISNALQWRLQYSRAIEKAGTISGLLSLFKS